MYLTQYHRFALLLTKLTKQVRQQDAYATNAGVLLQLCVTPRPFSRADCEPLSSLLTTIKINGGVKRMKKSRFSTNIWSMIAEC